jgi:DNA repair exonuclease SbcCD nuclease subunit
MKIAITSDIHLEFGDWYPVNPQNADVLLLSGDIMIASDLYGTHKTESFLSFLVNCKKEYAEVIYIMGNHEHYNGDYAETPKLLREACETRDIHFLDKESVKIGGVNFIGGTLWTDMNKEDPLTMHDIKSIMNDFRTIRNSNRIVTFKDDEGKFRQRASKLEPADVVVDHKAFLEMIRKTIAKNPTERFVIVGHHAPCKRSTKPQYEKDFVVNGAYSSDLSDFILDHPQIKVWTHGHTHHVFEYTIGETQIVCNPRGYVGYERSDNEDEPYVPKVVIVD